MVFYQIHLLIHSIYFLHIYSSEECGSESKRTRRILCKNEGTLEIVDDYLCGDQRGKPPEEEACEGKPCKVEWNETNYTY